MGDLGIKAGWDQAITSAEYLTALTPAGATNLIGTWYEIAGVTTLHYYAMPPEFVSNDVGTVGATIASEGYSVVIWRFDVMSEVAFNYARTTYNGKVTAQTPIWGSQSYTRRNMRSRLRTPNESIMYCGVKWFLNVEWELQYRKDST